MFIIEGCFIVLLSSDLYYCFKRLCFLKVSNSFFVFTVNYAQIWWHEVT